MKKQLFTIFILLPSLAIAQDFRIHLFPENVEALTENSERIASEPHINDESTNTPGIDERERITERAIGINAETVVTPQSKFVRLPLRYRMGNFAASLYIPYYYQRTVQYSHGPESAAGLGDLLARLEYRITGKMGKATFQANVKFPTGDANQQVNGFLVPMGTGSTDFMGGISTALDIGPLFWYNNVGYRFSGPHNRTVKIPHPDKPDLVNSIDYEITNGNTLAGNTTLHLPLFKNLSLQGGASIISNSSGTITQKHNFIGASPGPDGDKESAQQDFLFLDALAGLSLNIFGFDFILNLTHPLLTERNENNTEEPRTTMFFLRVNRLIF